MKTFCVITLLSTATIVNFVPFLLSFLQPATSTSSLTESENEKIDIAVNSKIYGIGYVEPESGVRRLAFPIGGRIAKWHVQPGERVEAGTPLVELDSSELMAEIELAEQRLNQARAERKKLLSGANPHLIEAAQHSLEICHKRYLLSKSVHERHEKLPESAISRADFDRTQMELSRSRSEYERAKAELNLLQNQVRPEDRLLADAQVTVAEAALANSKRKLQDRIIVAPTDGTVLERVRRIGESVSPVDPSTVAVFANSDKLHIRVEVDERFVNQLQVGMSATVYGRAVGSQEFKGRVRSIRQLMGKKTVFSRSSDERKELDVIQLIVETDQQLTTPIGVRLDVCLVPTAN